MKLPVATIALVLLATAACSTGAPASPSSAPPTGTLAPTAGTPTQTPAAATDTPTDAATDAPATDTPTDAPPSATAPAEGGTTWTIVMADGPREGTWEVSAPAGEVAACQYLPDLDRWLATWLGPPPLSFIDPRGDEDPFLLFSFDEEDGSELGFLPSGDVTFEADDRGDTATLTWVSESNDGTFRDASGNVTDEVSVGEVTLTIECGSIFRYT